MTQINYIITQLGNPNQTPTNINPNLIPSNINATLITTNTNSLS